MKIFCIGQNKTGTTSLEETFIKHGYKVGNQVEGEKLCKYWIDGNFEPIIEFAKTADFFQDRPFYMKDVYKHLDESFPNSKFILSVRNNPNEWYNSFIRHQSNIFGAYKIPTAKQLKRGGYCYPGWIYDVITNLYKTSDDDLYNKEKLTNYYTSYNKEVIEYFKDRPSDLLVINLQEANSYSKFCKFFNLKPLIRKFPHLNKTK